MTLRISMRTPVYTIYVKYSNIKNTQNTQDTFTIV